MSILKGRQKVSGCRQGGEKKEGVGGGGGGGLFD